MTLETLTSPSHPTNLSASLLRETRAALIFASQHEESGLSNFDHSGIRERVLGMSLASNDQPQVRIDSTGLSLNQKLFIERAVLRHLDSHEFSDATVYFQKSTSSSSSNATPAPVAKQHPLGLKISRRAIPGVKSIVAVASGKGGVGKSTVSANLAAGLAALGLKTGLMDCDIYGPSAPTMFGVSGSLQVEAGKLVPKIAHNVKLVSFGFFSDVKAPVVWRGPLVSKAIEQLCFEVQWGDLDVLVLDLPPGTGDVQMTLAERIPIAGSVIVTTPQDIALIDAHKAVSLFEKLDVPVLGVVENMAHFTCSACGHVDHIFGQERFDQFLKDRNLSLITQIPLTKQIREASDQGTPVTITELESRHPYQKLAKFVAETITLSNQNPQGEAPVDKDQLQ